MKNLKKALFIVPVVLLALTIYSFTTEEALAPPIPESSISIEQAKLNRASFLKNNDGDVTDVTFSYDEVKKFVELIEYKKAQGEDVDKIRVYMSQYANGKNTAFIAPIKKDQTPNYNINVINLGQQGVPPSVY